MTNIISENINESEDEIFIYPTDTVWGIGCSIYSERGFLKIVTIKKTTKDKPLSIMFYGIDEVAKYFQFPNRVTMEWLNDFFKLETTLALPLKSSRIKIPKWVNGSSSFVSLRCLESDVIKKIYKKVNGPFFTTSLNITGLEPITDQQAALDFQKKYAPAALIVTNTDAALTPQLSGSASTIVFFNENFQFEIKREGKRSEEVKAHLKKLFNI